LEFAGPGCAPPAPTSTSCSLAATGRSPRPTCWPRGSWLDYEVTLPHVPPGTYTVTARGVQSGTVQIQKFAIPDR
jgi:hypothetical protein